MDVYSPKHGKHMGFDPSPYWKMAIPQSIGVNISIISHDRESPS
jgi:hypothetical protein